MLRAIVFFGLAALRAEIPELMKIATGKEAPPPELDTFAAAFAVAGDNQEKVTDEETMVLLWTADPTTIIKKLRRGEAGARVDRLAPARIEQDGLEWHPA